MHVLRFFLLLLCLSLVPQAACVRQQAGGGSATQLEVLRHGQLEEPEGDADVPPVVYVNVRDNTNRVFGLGAQAENCLRQNGYTVVPNPSQAGYIVQVVVLAAGRTSPEAARAVVNAGYDAPSKLAGQGATALVTDILLVQRRVPQAQRPSRQKLKTISHRNAVGNSQMRLGLLARQEARQDAGLPAYFTEALARELASALHAANKGDAPPAASPAKP